MEKFRIPIGRWSDSFLTISRNCWMNAFSQSGKYFHMLPYRYCRKKECENPLFFSSHALRSTRFISGSNFRIILWFTWWEKGAPSNHFIKFKLFQRQISIYIWNQNIIYYVITSWTRAAQNRQNWFGHQGKWKNKIDDSTITYNSYDRFDLFKTKFDISPPFPNHQL